MRRRAKICFVIYIAGIFFLKKICYEVIVKQKIYKRASNYYSHGLVVARQRRRRPLDADPGRRPPTHIYQPSPKDGSRPENSGDAPIDPETRTRLHVCPALPYHHLAAPEHRGARCKRQRESVVYWYSI